MYVSMAVAASIAVASLGFMRSQRLVARASVDAVASWPLVALTAGLMCYLTVACFMDWVVSSGASGAYLSYTLTSTLEGWVCVATGVTCGCVARAVAARVDTCARSLHGEGGAVVDAAVAGESVAIVLVDVSAAAQSGASTRRRGADISPPAESGDGDCARVCGTLSDAGELVVLAQVCVAARLGEMVCARAALLFDGNVQWID